LSRRESKKVEEEKAKLMFDNDAKNSPTNQEVKWRVRQARKNSYL
jgi:hypothetical protein